MEPSSALLTVPVSNLALPPQTTAYLLQLGIKTIGDLVARVRVAGLAKDNKRASAESARAMRCLLAASAVDWESYELLHRPPKPVLPARNLREWSPSDFLADLPSALTEMTKLQFQGDHMAILRFRLLAKWGERLTQAELGTKLGVSRERIQFVERRMVEVIQRALLRGDYRRCHFVFQPGFGQPLRHLAHAAKTTFRRPLNDAEWRELIRTEWGLGLKQMNHCEDLVLQILTGRSPNESATRSRNRSPAAD